MKNAIFSPIIKRTERLILRTMKEHDAEQVYLHRNQPDVSVFQGWTPKDSEAVAAYAREMQKRPACTPGFWYQIVLERRVKDEAANEQRARDKPSEVGVIGDVAFCIDKETQKQAELGVAIDTRYQSNGFAQEAIVALVDFLFETFGLHRIHVSIDPANRASRQLFKRVGFREEGHLIKASHFNGEWCDDIIMAILNQEWQEWDAP